MTHRRLLPTALLALAALPATASNWNQQVTEFQWQGADRRADCGRELFMRASSGGEPAEMILRLGCAARPSDGAGGMITLQVLRIELPGDAEAVLTVAGLSAQRFSATGELAGFVQGPATGRCDVTGLDRADPELRCSVQAANAALGSLRLALRLDAESTRRQWAAVASQFARELREARFTLAAAEQAGRLARWEPKSQGMAAPAAPSGPLTEQTCVEEAQAREAEARAAGGDTAAAVLAGVCWRNAAQRQPDKGGPFLARAAEWLDKAVARGDVRAMVEKGVLIRIVTGNGTWDAATSSFKRPAPEQAARNYQEAGRLFRQAAERGDAAGQWHTCEQLAGYVQPPDLAGAVRWCQAAADQGHPQATARLADYYAYGRGVPKDPARARQLVMLAAERGDKGTLHQLARAYELGMTDTPAGPIERNVAKAIELYQRTGNTAKVAELTAAQGRLGAGVDATVYGIAVGFQLPSMSNCNTPGSDPEARLCADPDVGALTRFLDRIGLERQAFADSGLRLLAVKVNDAKMDTRLLFALLGQSAALDVAVDGNRTVHYVSASTRITEGDAVLRMLTAKYGAPTGSEWVEWRNTRTGELVRRTPLHHWALRGLAVDFHVQSASTLGNLETPMGRIDIYTPIYSELLARFAAQKSSGQPKGRF